MLKEDFGIMDEGYFSSRSEIIPWINNLLQLNISKIEQLGSGAVYCQILDSMYPDKVQMNKVNFKAKLEYEFIGNLKVLQQAFDKLQIKRHIEVEKLCKCKYQDNLEFIQWMKRLFDCNGGGSQAEYDAVARRKGVEPDFGFAIKIVQPKTFDPNGNQIIAQPAEKAAAPTKRPEKENQKIESNVQPKLSLAHKNSDPGLRAPVDLLPSKKPLPSASSALQKKATQLDDIRRIMLSKSLSETQKLAKISEILDIASSDKAGPTVTEKAAPAAKNVEGLADGDELLPTQHHAVIGNSPKLEDEIL